MFCHAIFTDSYSEKKQVSVMFHKGISLDILESFKEIIMN